MKRVHSSPGITRSVSLDPQVGGAWARFTTAPARTALLNCAPPSAVEVESKRRVRLPVHIIATLVSLCPLFAPKPPSCWHVILPAVYILGTASEVWVRRRTLAHILGFRRLISQRSLPNWFAAYCAMQYFLLVFQLVGRAVAAVEESHAYPISCWFHAVFGHQEEGLWMGCPPGLPLEQRASCEILRYGTFGAAVHFYGLLLVVASSNEDVRGEKALLGQRHVLEELSDRAKQLLAYVDRCVDHNEQKCLADARYALLSVLFSLTWACVVFVVQVDNFARATSAVARAIFLASVPSAFVTQYLLSSFVLRDTLLRLEGVKARAAALTSCDTAGVLAFRTAEDVYIWYTVRRALHGSNRVSYKSVSMNVALLQMLAVLSSLWLGRKIVSEGLSVYTLTYRGGLSLVLIATASVSLLFLFTFLHRMLSITRYEDAQLQQLRYAHLRLTCACPGPTRRNATGQDDVEVGIAEESEHCRAALREVISLLERGCDCVRPNVFGMEIGPGLVSAMNGTLITASTTIMVWGVFIPLLRSD